MAGDNIPTARTHLNFPLTRGALAAVRPPGAPCAGKEASSLGIARWASGQTAANIIPRFVLLGGCLPDRCPACVGPAGSSYRERPARLIDLCTSAWPERRARAPREPPPWARDPDGGVGSSVETSRSVHSFPRILASVTEPGRQCVPISDQKILSPL